ncbi:MAG: 3-dehydroquinate synthase [Bacteroidetes bacterium 4572_77]|nr:MAG: 3-dehydroquinate synthase [Bacteroidetes bacterium 4572_77]
MTEIIKTKNYSILLQNDIGHSIDEFIQEAEYSNVFLLMEENIMEYCWPILKQQSRELNKAEILLLEPGESQKSIEIAHQLWNTLSQYQADRSSLIVNFGGGMISDLGGFVASTYKRGIDFINIPTSLLAMVDASIGGKTAINLGKYKNQVGVFNPAKAVFISMEFLNTLNKRNLLNGYAEMLKHGLISHKEHWNKLLQLKELQPKDLIPNIAQSIEIKKAIAEEDPLEKSSRKSLNFGHTIGHLLESWSLKHDKEKERWLHGESIAAGLVMESYLSFKQGKLQKKDFKIIKNHIQKHFPKFPITPDLLSSFPEIIFQDKKKNGKKLNLTFVPAIGSFLINQNCTIEEIKKALIYYKENY